MEMENHPKCKKTNIGDIPFSTSMIMAGRVQYVVVSENRGTPKSSILIGFFIINHPFWGAPIFGNTHVKSPHKKA